MHRGAVRTRFIPNLQTPRTELNPKRRTGTAGGTGCACRGTDADLALVRTNANALRSTYSLTALTGTIVLPAILTVGSSPRRRSASTT